MTLQVQPRIGLVDRWLRRYRTMPPLRPQTTPAVLITGGSDGIGLGLALAFDRDPSWNSTQRLVLVSRNADALARAAETVHQQRGTVPLVLALDVTAGNAIAVIEQLLATQGLHVDVLINNAGIGHAGAFTEATPDHIEQLLALNIAALTRLTRHFLPDMLARGTGGVMNVASLGGLTPGPYQAAYYASKAFVISFTRALQSENAGQGVRIAVVAPGPVETQFHRRMGAESAFYRRLIPAPSAEFVARVAIRGFRWGRTMIIPGWSWSVLALTMTHMPAAVTVPIVRWLLRPRG
jgi:uncharacterized protein